MWLYWLTIWLLTVSFTGPPATSFNHIQNVVFFWSRTSLAHNTCRHRKEGSWPGFHWIPGLLDCCSWSAGHFQFIFYICRFYLPLSSPICYPFRFYLIMNCLTMLLLCCCICMYVLPCMQCILCIWFFLSVCMSVFVWACLTVCVCVCLSVNSAMSGAKDNCSVWSNKRSSHFCAFSSPLPLNSVSIGGQISLMKSWGSHFPFRCISSPHFHSLSLLHAAHSASQNGAL